MLTPSQYYRISIKKLYEFVVPKGNHTLFLDAEEYIASGKYDYIVLDNIVGDITDVQLFLTKLKNHCHRDTRVVVTYYNHLWEPVLKLATYMGWRDSVREQNWLDNKDIANFLELSGYEIVTYQKRVIFPADVPVLSSLLNKYLANLPIINEFCLITYVVAKQKQTKREDYSVSIIIPARNEEGNIDNAIKLLPKFGKSQEVIFVEGHSRDNTWSKINSLLKKTQTKKINISAYKQKGVGKADAVRLGFQKAKGEVLMILDADLTVSPKELPKFYEAIAEGHGEYINGSRLVYPMEKDAMRTLNKMGNVMFSWLFTWILGQRIKDTLCGTKVIKKTDYEKIVKNRSFFGDFDPFGDFDLIFGSIKQNLKLVEIPIRYKERTYGSTNISRFKHGWLLLKMTYLAYIKIKTW